MLEDKLNGTPCHLTTNFLTRTVKLEFNAFDISGIS